MHRVRSAVQSGDGVSSCPSEGRAWRRTMTQQSDGLLWLATSARVYRQTGSCASESLVGSAAATVLCVVVATSAPIWLLRRVATIAGLVAATGITSSGNLCDRANWCKCEAVRKSRDRRGITKDPAV